MAGKSKKSELEEERRPLLQPSTSAAGVTGDNGGAGTSQSGQPKPKQSSALRQVFLGVVVALPSVPFGMSLGFSAIAFDELVLSVDEASWFASATALAYPVGALIVGPLMDKYGRRPALLLINLVSFFGWLLLAVPSVNPSIFKLITGRMLTGIAGGLASVPASVYAAECLSSCDTTRSTVVAWSTVALSAGICLVYTAGSFLEYYAVASIATLITVASFVLVALVLPESPVWYTMKGRHGDAEWSLREININPPPAPPEQPSEVEEPGRQPPPPPPPAPPETFKELLKPEAYKPLLIMIGFFFFQQFSGVFVIIAYMVDIIRAAGVITVNPYSITVIAGTIILTISLMASLIYPRSGVRTIAIISGIGTTITMFFMGIFLSLRIYWINRASWDFLNWIPVFSILSSITASTLGFLILPWSMLGEVFPNNVKGLAASIATCLGFIFSFIATKIYPYIQLGLGVEGIFLFFGLMALLGTIFVMLFLPETRGKTFEEILGEFTKPSKKKSSMKKTKDEAPSGEPSTATTST